MSNTKDTTEQQTSSSSRHKGMTASTAKIEPKRQFTNSRRERPRKLRVFSDELPRSQDLYEADIDSFVSTCAPGLSFGKNYDGNDVTDGEMLSPRASSIHKRSLPSLSFLATTTIAAEKKKLKIEEEKRKEVIAEMEARKALALNPLHSSDDVGKTKEDKPSCVNHLSSELQSATVIDNTKSNVTMPPLLKQFLYTLSKGGEKRDGDNNEQP
mmetsp:Transcript_25043/g.37904  ORF Transcript_25043/g.37904 Transcript_25043/m.37904 type:complete len:212 (-) Transcript_25043:204-839(-)|eukprot:scaffold5701_cov155-Skeletonema_dohrnii-CCMP3373.AAC.5